MLGKEFRYIAFYDLDHTILKDNSATHLVHVSKDRGTMSKRHFRHAVWLSLLYKLGIGDPTKMITRMLGWIRGKGAGDLEELCQEIFNDRIVHNHRYVVEQKGHTESTGIN